MNTEDRELLELAAKAACVKDFVFCAETGAPFDAVGYWNPLEDDGDALRLAVTLGITPSWYAALGYATARYDIGSRRLEEYGTDPYAATRRAIVRAAAEIGRRIA